LQAIRIPTLVANALNDPFVPADSLPSQAQAGKHVTLWQPMHGGHVGFSRGAPPSRLDLLPEVVGGFLIKHL
jgi:predicted alpha/beta-fold hydrolase